MKPFLLCVLFFSAHLPQYIANNVKWYRSCATPFSCGNITGVDYPFWGNNRSENCGHPGFELHCDDGVITKIEMAKVTYRVLGINKDTKTFRLARKDLSDDFCNLEDFANTTLDPLLFDYGPGHQNLTILYGCPPPSVPPHAQLTCTSRKIEHKSVHVELGAKGPGSCHASVVVPIRESVIHQETGDLARLNLMIREGFEVRWKMDGKKCDKWKNSSGPLDIVSKIKDPLAKPAHKKGIKSGSSEKLPIKKKIPSATPLSGLENKATRENVPLTIGLSTSGAVLFGLALGWFVFSYIQKQKRRNIQSNGAAQTNIENPNSTLSTKGLINASNDLSRSIPSYPSSKEYLRQRNSYLGVQVFSYAELQEATDNFDQSKELGDGGYGVVYYGKLRDGSTVAVKRLYENNFKRVAQFINEVEILARLQHQNLVRLYGCTSKQSRDLLLVYEYVPNGTLCEHLRGNRANCGFLSWPARLNVAIETADALVYLHASEVVHRDVKTNNLLLDNDFHVKVADFGLSRLFPADVTHVSTAPQGTPGYIDPEYFQCYHLTSKSDVYSFGVVLIELISSKQALDTSRHHIDINLANMAIKRIQTDALHELVDPRLGFVTDSSVKRTVTLVAELAFRCLQPDRNMRPSMQEVLDDLRKIKSDELNSAKTENLVVTGK